VGDDYTGDPAQEQQGLNSVFSGDESTLQVVKSQVKKMAELR
jgi:mannan endo-1,4-beta-mannosidase